MKSDGGLLQEITIGRCACSKVDRVLVLVSDHECITEVILKPQIVTLKEASPSSKRIRNPCVSYCVCF